MLQKRIPWSQNRRRRVPTLTRLSSKTTTRRQLAIGTYYVLCRRPCPWARIELASLLAAEAVAHQLMTQRMRRGRVCVSCTGF